MRFEKYNRLKALQRKPSMPKFDKNCIGPCNAQMVKLGRCICEKNKPKKPNAFFQFRFWMTVAVILVLASWLFHVDFVIGVLIILLTYAYFQFKK